MTPHAAGMLYQLRTTSTSIKKWMAFVVRNRRSARQIAKSEKFALLPSMCNELSRTAGLNGNPEHSPRLMLRIETSHPRSAIAEAMTVVTRSVPPVRDKSPKKKQIRRLAGWIDKPVINGAQLEPVADV